MNLKEILERNGIETKSCDQSYLTLPAKIFFLEKDYLEKCCSLAKIPDDLQKDLLDFAIEINNSSTLKLLAWHLHRLYCVLPEFKAFPDHIDLTGSKTGILYLIIFFSFYGPLKNHIALNNLPDYLADRAMERLTPLLGYRGIHYPGEKGLQGKALGYVLNYQKYSCFRIGRFDFILAMVPGNYPELFRERKTGAYKMLCRANWNIGDDGKLHNLAEEPFQLTEFIESENSCTGRVIDPVSGIITSETETVDLKEYERILAPGSLVLQMHIPGGGGMTPEVCKESFMEAKKFFAEYFPDHPIAAIGCISWILNPAWRKYLPESNLAKFQRATLAFPFPPVAKSGLYFIFGRDDDDKSKYTPVNSMQQAMMKAWQAEELCSAGMLIPFDEIENFPLDVEK